MAGTTDDQSRSAGHTPGGHDVSAEPTVLCRVDSPVHLCLTGWSGVAPGSSCDLVVLHGELDIFTVAVSRAALFGWVDATAAGCVHVDLSGVEFIDARGVHLLTEARSRAACRGVEVSLRRPSPIVERVYEICGLDGVLEPSADRQRLGSHSGTGHR